MQIELGCTSNFVNVDFNTPVIEISLDGLYAERDALFRLMKYTNPYMSVYHTYIDRYNEICEEIHNRESENY